MIFKKSMIVLFFLFVLMSGNVTFAEASEAEIAVSFWEEEAAEYDIGDKLQGFTLTEEWVMESPSALVRIWMHDKTGAQVYFIHNDDLDRTFSIAFRTEPSDDTGKLHILEHAVCAASEKYPGQDVFFDAVAQAYITDINASTYKSATNYYVSSMSEDQLERMADVYLDCAFNSELRNEPNYFYREGWRYSMENEESPLTVDGIVYNEMKGIFGDIYEVHYAIGMARALFPDTYQQWESGGDPAVIPELTYKELIDFYDECYHPSNSVSMFYGDVATERYLKLMDEEYFSQFDAKDSFKYSPGQEAFGHMVKFEQDFPVSADSEQTRGLISYAVVLPENVSFSEILALSIGKEYLGDPSSLLMEQLYASGIGSNYYVEDTITGTQYSLIFTADEADTSRAEEFTTIVRDGLTAMIKTGFEQQMLDSIFEARALNEALVSNQQGVGIEMASRIAQVVYSGYTEFLNQSASFDEAKEHCTKGGLELLLDQYVLQNTHAALVTTTPKAGLQEEQEAEEVKVLAEKKEAMSQEELDAIIADTAAFAKWNDEMDSDPKTLEKLRTETPDTVYAEIPVYETSDLDVDGAVLYTADVEGEVTYCQYDFDISHLTVEEIRALDVYVELLGTSTEKRNQQEISIAVRSLLNEIDASVEVKTRADGSVYPVLSLSFYALDEKLADAANLVMEMFHHTDLTDNTEYFEMAIAGKIQNYYDVEHIEKNMALDASLSGSSDSSMLQYALFGMDYYTWLLELREVDTGILSEKFMAARKKALVREGAAVIAVGNAEGQEERGALLCSLLPEKGQAQEAADWYHILSEAPKQPIAFKSNGTSSYLVSGLDISSIDLKNTGELQLLLAIMEDVYLLPEFRFQLGAYSSSARLSETGIYKLKLFRSPSYYEAFSRLSELPEEMEEFLTDMTAEQLAGYQLSVISGMTQPAGLWNEAADQIDYERRGIDVADRQAVLEQVCNATLESLKEALPELQKIIEASGVAVLAPGTAVEEHKEMFDSVVVLP